MRNQEIIEHIAETYSKELSLGIDLEKIAIVNDVKKKIIKILSDDEECDELINDVLYEAQAGPITAIGSKRNAILYCAGYPMLEQCDNPHIFADTVMDKIEGIEDVDESSLEDAIREGIVNSWVYEYCCDADAYWNMVMDDAAKEKVIEIDHIAETYAKRLTPVIMQWIGGEARKWFEHQQNHAHHKNLCRTNHRGRSPLVDKAVVLKR